MGRQEDGLELIASENFVSLAVLEAAGSVMTNKYASNANEVNTSLQVMLAVSKTLFTHAYILISTSQPAGRLRFIRLSIVLGVGSKTSINRLWTRISNCSRPFL